jgi:ABC-type branched-subunit amino acid transport system substrate-binding protein
MYKNTRRILGLMLILALLVPTVILVQAQDCTFADEQIVFGGLAPMSAPGAVAGGVAMDWAFKQAAADINAECGIEIDGVNYELVVITGDSEGSPERAQAAAERLILDEGVHGMVGVYHSWQQWVSCKKMLFPLFSLSLGTTM